MAFTIVLDRYLNESVTEYGAILDLELKTGEQKYQGEFEKLLKDDTKLELLSQIVDSSKSFLPNFTDKSLEPTVNLYLHTLDVLTSDLGVDITEALAQVLENIDVPAYTSISTDVKPTSVISVLSNIFNFVPEESQLRVGILNDIVDLVSTNDLQSLLLPIAESFPLWLSKIDDVNNDDWRSLANGIFSQIYEQNQTEALKFYKKLIQSEDGAQKLEAQDYDDFLLKALTSNKYFNIFDLDIASKLGDATLSQLLKLVQDADIQGFLTFISNEGKSLSETVNVEKLTYKVKYLAIARVLEAIEEETGRNEFTYEHIAKELDIPLEDIEEFLINCIHQGLITGRLSQVKQVFYLSKIDRLSTPSKSLDSKDWQRANKYLQDWSSTIEGMQSLIKNLISRKGKRTLPPQAIQIFHQQKQELKEHLQQEKQKERERQQEIQRREDQEEEQEEEEEEEGEEGEEGGEEQREEQEDVEA
ncbi:DEKNAAC102386 [Brettanomyces naardenensis]|uniref:DEKNAAC102386 n=1 Tax=Brettanomyces naardenensis TaxID=13370 RepID=A0A448YKA7_BRENA|nr:DEKNAAC102386 [Brettanomyces naardenensis]